MRKDPKLMDSHDMTASNLFNAISALTHGVINSRGESHHASAAIRSPYRSSRLLGVVVLALFVSACGFHLRGNIPLPASLQNMFVKAPDGTFKDMLEDVLINAGAQLALSEQSADVVLVVAKADTRRDVGTLDERGLANSYDLTFSARYNIVDAAGEVIRPMNTVSERRRYDFDPALVVETESEERELQEDMEQDVALKIIRQLSTMTDYQPGLPQGSTDASGKGTESAVESGEE